jgi:hypothetical protein
MSAKRENDLETTLERLRACGALRAGRPRSQQSLDRFERVGSFLICEQGGDSF